MGMKKQQDPNIITDFEPGHFQTIVEDSGILYEDIYLSEDFFIKSIILSACGVFFVIPGEVKDIKPLLEQFGLTRDNAFFFFYTDEEAYLFDDDPIELDDIYEAFRMLYTNLNRSLTDQAHLRFTSLQEMLCEPNDPYEEKDVKEDFEYEGIQFEMKDPFFFEDGGENTVIPLRVDQETFKRLDILFTKMEGNDRPDPKAKVKVGEDGLTYVKRHKERKIGGFDTGLVGEEAWFRMSDENPNAFIFKTAFFGWLGAHKFGHGEILAGILYFLSCGCIGILPAFDILACILGNASYSIVNYQDGATLVRSKEKVYLGKPKNIFIGIIGIIISLAIGYCMFRFVYTQIFTFLGGAIGTVADGMVQNSQVNF